jgi:hypothetical protein
MAYVRLFIIVFVVNTILIWLVGDFNTYLGYGAEQEFKSFPPPFVREFGSLIGGFVSAGICTFLFAFPDMCCRKKVDTPQDSELG